MIKFLQANGARLGHQDKRGLTALDTAMGLAGGFGFGGSASVVHEDTAKAIKELGGIAGTPIPAPARLAWNEQGTWTRLRPGDVDPAIGGVYLGPDHRALLHAGDLLLVDEAGMLDQDTARALLTVADETGARLVLVGDRHQLPAVGRGGVLDLAHRWVDPAAHVLLDAVHRFVDAEYARLSLAM